MAQKEVKTPVAVVVGAGPAGIAAASALARRGWHCEVFEHREEPTAQKNPRGYPMSLNARSLRTLKLAGLEVNSVGAKAQNLQGYIFNCRPLQLYQSDNPEERTYLVDRVAFNRELYVSAAANTHEYAAHGGSINWHFGQDLHSIDFDARTATFAPATSMAPSEGPGLDGQSSLTTASYDLLIGCDGYNSAVRREMAAARHLEFEIVLEALTTYKTFHELEVAPQVEEAIQGVNTQNPGQYLYMFKKPGTPAVAMWKQRDGSFSGMMTSFNSWEETDLRAALATLFPSPALDSWVEPIIQATREEGKQRPAHFSRIVKLSQFHGPHCVLLGDSAHAVTSKLGNGCNLALESVRVFVSTLDRVGLEAAPKAFTEARLPDAHAFQTLEYHQTMCQMSAPQVMHGVTRMCTRMERWWALLLMQLSSLPMMMLNKLLPGVFKHQSLLACTLHNADLPFTQVKRMLQLNAGLVVVAAVGALAGVLGLGALALKSMVA